MQNPDTTAKYYAVYFATRRIQRPRCLPHSQSLGRRDGENPGGIGVRGFGDHKPRPIQHERQTLRANDNETQTFRKFTLEGAEGSPSPCLCSSPPARSRAPDAPSPEISARPRRRTFTARDKLRILAETDRAAGTGQIGLILRREGLYSSNPTDWRKARDAATNGALAPAKRGRSKMFAAAASGAGSDRLSGGTPAVSVVCRSARPGLAVSAAPTFPWHKRRGAR